MKNILFVTYGGGHVQAVVPMIKQLLKIKTYRVYVIGLSTAEKILKEEYLPSLRLEDFIDDEIKEIGKQLADQYHKDDMGIRYNTTMAYYGIGMNDLMQQHGEEAAWKIFNEEGRKAFLPVHFIASILKKLNIDFVITTSSPRFELAALLAANLQGVPSLRIEQFFGSGNIPKGLESTIFCVMNAYVRDTLMKKKVNPNHIFITGQPAFDKLINETICEEEKRKIEQKYNIDPNRKKILWACQGSIYEETLLNILIDVEQRHPKYQFIFKLHPNEDSELHYNTIWKRNSKAIVTREDLHPLISISDVVVTECSTVGLESIFLGKPLITFNITGEPDVIPYAETEVSVGVYQKDALESAIAQVLFHEETQKRLASGRKNYFNDGQATTRVGKIIEDMLNQGSESFGSGRGTLGERFPASDDKGIESKRRIYYGKSC